LSERLFCWSANDKAHGQQQDAAHGASGAENEPIRASVSHLIAPPSQWSIRLLYNGKCELVHTAALTAALHMLMLGNRRNSIWGHSMQPNAKLASHASRTGEPSLSHWAFAAHAAMALIVIVLSTLTLAALEVFLSGDESLSALEAAVM
jgi:hypothetical protein